MTDAKNFNCYKRLINRQLLQFSGLCGTPFFSYLPKRSTQIYRAHYGDAMLVPTLRDTNMAAGNQWKHLELTFAMRTITLPSPNVLTVQTAKNLKKKTFFQTRQLCHGAALRSSTAEISKIQDAVFWTERMLPSWKLVKRYIFSCSFTWWQ